MRVMLVVVVVVVVVVVFSSSLERAFSSCEGEEISRYLEGRQASPQAKLFRSSFQPVNVAAMRYGFVRLKGFVLASRDG